MGTPPPPQKGGGMSVENHDLFILGNTLETY